VPPSSALDSLDGFFPPGEVIFIVGSRIDSVVVSVSNVLHFWTGFPSWPAGEFLLVSLPKVGLFLLPPLPALDRNLS